MWEKVKLLAHVIPYRAEMQVATTQDYATDSWFWTVFTGEIINVSTILMKLIQELGIKLL